MGERITYLITCVPGISSTYVCFWDLKLEGGRVSKNGDECGIGHNLLIGQLLNCRPYTTANITQPLGARFQARLADQPRGRH